MNNTRLRRLRAMVLVPALAACGSSVDNRAVTAMARVPASAARYPAMPAGVTVAATWTDPSGRGVAALSDGSFVVADSTLALAPLDWFPGETPMTGDFPASSVQSRGRDDALALTPGGAILVQNGLVRHALLPAFLSAPRAYATFGGEALWATADGLYASDADRWYALGDNGDVRDATALAGFSGDAGERRAWVLRNGSVKQVHYAPGTTPQVSWDDPFRGGSVGAVSAIGAMDARRGAAIGEHGLIVSGPDGVTVFRGGDGDPAPVALGAGGGWAWVAWQNVLMRTDGSTWESLVMDMQFGAGTKLSVDHDTGATALASDAGGRLVRVDVERVLRLSGLHDGDVVYDPAVDLAALPPPGDAPTMVTYALDGNMVASRTTAPWGWGDDGARTRDLSGLEFDAHSVTITATYAGGASLTRTVGFHYASPFGHVPSYASEILPVFTAHCARCHTSGIARDLSTYDRISAQGPIVRAAVREHRMPPDILLDPQSVALITAWVDGDTPP